VANFSYAIPNRWGAVPKRISNGWTVLGIYNEQSGFPFNITGPFGTQQFGFDTLNFLGARPFFVQKAPRNKSGVPQFFASSVVAQNGLNGTYFNVPTVPNATLGTVQTAPGDLGRNTYTGPGWWNYDMSVSKDTHIAERIKFQFRAEFFNILNHATFATPTSNLGNTSFGYSLSTASPERQIQFGGRFEF
jgi:hypothetical protein